MNKLYLYPWLHSHFKQLISSYQTGRGHHALIIQTLPNMGEDLLVYFISQFLMCQQPIKYRGCGRCRSCQLMQTKTHPDYYSLEPEKNKNIIGIDVIREINEKIYGHANLGKAKVVWLKDATQLTEESANALLKILEEPPEKTWFFFSCQEPSRLLVTLRSRCLLYRLSIPDENLAISWLAHKVTISPEERLASLRLCGGAPDAALVQLQPGIWSKRKQLFSALQSALENNDWLILLNILLDYEFAVQKLYWLASLLLDAMKLQQEVTFLNNIDVWSLINMIASNLSNIAIQTILSKVCKTRWQLLTISGLNFELILTDLLLCIEHSYN